YGLRICSIDCVIYHHHDCNAYPVLSSEKMGSLLRGFMMVKKVNWKNILVHIFLILGAVVVVLPFYWMVITALKTNAETMTIPPTLLPQNWQFGNFIEVLQEFNFGMAYLNTIIVTAGRTLGQVLFCSMAAFAIATMRFPFGNIVFIMMISVLMFTAEMFMIAVYNLMITFNWMDTYYVLAVMIMGSSFDIFLVFQFFFEMPKDLF